MGRLLSLGLSGAMLVFIGCSSRDHSEIVNQKDSTVTGSITVVESQIESENTESMPLLAVNECKFNSGAYSFSGKFLSEDSRFQVELTILDIASPRRHICYQGPLNHSRKQNEADEIKFTGCYVSVRIGDDFSFSQYDMHRKSPSILDYKYDDTCEIDASIDLKKGWFKANSIKCNKMASTYRDSLISNPVDKSRFINFSANHVSCKYQKI